MLPTLELIIATHLAEILACVGVEHRDAKTLAADPDMGEILLDLFGRLRQIRAVERRGDGEEAVDEADLPFGEGDPRLVETGGCLDLSQPQIEPVKRNGRTGDDEITRAVDERNPDVAVFR